ncbi:DUF4870 domain-containing protein [Parasphingorhabdus flavimaris]|uniref:DUF4870 domain-containing protein n=1 Tax=Parasphingorhabdus flavimaris TaxID=266812 RepID=A0ABX2N571_9SPHN|nr:DUF4870 domain-containing protein [Parasphingorhabdus flavimaris]NVD28861.1 DUF4870 domain-containing protein [Parasphingorhabdus flavimaris]
MSEKAPKATATGFDFNKATIVSLLYIAGFVVGITGIVGFILALVWKDEVAGTWEESHLQFHVRTFVIGLVVGIIGGILSIILIGIPILLALFLWILVRSVVALSKAQKHEPMADPKSWLL